MATDVARRCISTYIGSFCGSHRTRCEEIEQSFKGWTTIRDDILIVLFASNWQSSVAQFRRMNNTFTQAFFSVQTNRFFYYSSFQPLQRYSGLLVKSLNLTYSAWIRLLFDSHVYCANTETLWGFEFNVVRFRSGCHYGWLISNWIAAHAFTGKRTALKRVHTRWKSFRINFRPDRRARLPCWNPVLSANSRWSLP